jgi:uncharacterized membrane protein YeaQ/YmgE (transglycosylase-associated protein family)
VDTRHRGGGQIHHAGQGPGGGIIVTSLIGIAGSFIASSLGERLAGIRKAVRGFIMSVIGAVVFVAVYHMLKPKTS